MRLFIISIFISFFLFSQEETKKYGGSERIYSPVEKALRWTNKVQNEDGSWGGKHKTIMTSLVLLSHFARGESINSKDYGEVIKKGLGFLKKEANKKLDQHKMGLEGAYILWALSDAVLIAGVQEQQLCKKLDLLLKTEFKINHWAAEQNENLLNVVAPTAIFSAYRANADTVESLDFFNAAKQWFIADFDFENEDKEKNFYYLFLKSLRERANEKEINDLLSLFLKKDKVSYFENYLASKIFFNYGGKVWMKWNRHYQKLLTASQDPKGNWPVSKNNQFKMDENEQMLYNSVFAELSLSIYYRYIPTFTTRTKKKEKLPKRAAGAQTIEALELSKTSVNMEIPRFDWLQHAIDNSILPYDISIQSQINQYNLTSKQTSQNGFIVDFELGDCPWNKDKKLLFILVKNEKGKDLKCEISVEFNPAKVTKYSLLEAYDLIEESAPREHKSYLLKKNSQIIAAYEIHPRQEKIALPESRYRKLTFENSSELLNLTIKGNDFKKDFQFTDESKKPGKNWYLTASLYYLSNYLIQESDQYLADFALENFDLKGLKELIHKAENQKLTTQVNEILKLKKLYDKLVKINIVEERFENDDLLDDKGVIEFEN